MKGNPDIPEFEGSTRNLFDESISEIRGLYINHAISVESSLDGLLIWMYLPRAAPVDYQMRFRNFILGSRGLSFEGKVSAMLGAVGGRAEDESTSTVLFSTKKVIPPRDPEIASLAKKVRNIIERRNAIAHADYDVMQLSRTPTGENHDNPTDPTFYLNVFSTSGSSKPTRVSLSIVKRWIRDGQSVIQELDRLMLKFSGLDRLITKPSEGNKPDDA